MTFFCFFFFLSVCFLGNLQDPKVCCAVNIWSPCSVAINLINPSILRFIEIEWSILSSVEVEWSIIRFTEIEWVTDHRFHRDGMELCKSERGFCLCSCWACSCKLRLFFGALKLLLVWSNFVSSFGFLSQVMTLFLFVSLGSALHFFKLARPCLLCVCVCVCVIWWSPHSDEFNHPWSVL